MTYVPVSKIISQCARIFSTHLHIAITCTRVSQSWMRPPFIFISQLDEQKYKWHQRKELSLMYYVCKNAQEKEQGCLFHSISCEPCNRHRLKKKDGKPHSLRRRLSVLHQGTRHSRTIRDRNSLWAENCKKPVICSFKSNCFPVGETFSVWGIKHFRQ